MRKILIFLFIALIPIKAQAECDLKQDKIFQSQNWAMQYSYITSLSETEFNRAMQDAQFQTIIKALPVQANYSSVTDYLRSINTTTGLNISSTDSNNLMQTVASDNDVLAYKACVEQQSVLLAIPRFVTPQSVTVRVYWHPSGAEKLRSISINSLSGGTHTGKIGRPPINGSIDLTFNRISGQPFVATIDGEFGPFFGPKVTRSDTVNVPWEKQATVTYTSITRSSDDADLLLDGASRLQVTHQAHEGGDDSRPFSLLSKPGYTIEKNSVGVTQVHVNGGCSYPSTPTSADDLTITSDTISGIERMTAPAHCGGTMRGVINWREVHATVSITK